MKKYLRYFTVQKYKSDNEGYPIPVNHCHIMGNGNLETTLCGLKVVREMEIKYGSYTIERWLMEKTTCKKCLRIMSNMVLEMSVGKIEERKNL